MTGVYLTLTVQPEYSVTVNSDTDIELNLLPAPQYNITLSEVGSIVSDVVGDTTPQLGGDLDLNSNDITGTGNINITGTIQSSGNITGTLATAAQPNITSVGTLTALTGGTGDLNWDSGTLFVDSSANAVGIGTTSPQTTLHLSNNTTAPILRLGNEDNSIAAGADLGVIQFYSGDGSGGGDAVKATISAIQPATSPVSGELVFKTSLSAGSLTTAMTIDSSQNVGIGCTPDAWSGYSVLQIGTAGCLAASEDTTFVGANAYSSASGWKYVTTDEASLYQQESGSHIWYGAASGSADAAISWSERMRINSNGDIGINTSSPIDGSKLDVVDSDDMTMRVRSTGSSSAAIRFQNSTTGTTTNDGLFVGIGTDETGYVWHYENNPLLFATNNTERMRIDSSGNVGIGFTSPQAKLQVLDQLKVSTSDQSQGVVALGDGSSTQFGVGIARWNGSSNSGGAGGLGYFSQGTVNSGGHFFYTGDAAAGSTTERMRIDSSGNVDLLQSNHLRWKHAAGGTIRASIDADSSDNLMFYTGPSEAERMRITSAGIINSPPTYAQTTSNSANMVVRSGGDFERSTSSERYKNSITDATKGFQN